VVTYSTNCSQKQQLVLRILQGKMEEHEPPSPRSVVVSSGASVVDDAVLQQLNNLLQAICEQNNFVHSEGTQSTKPFMFRTIKCIFFPDQLPAGAAGSL